MVSGFLASVNASMRQGNGMTPGLVSLDAAWTSTSSGMWTVHSLHSNTMSGMRVIVNATVHLMYPSEWIPGLAKQGAALITTPGPSHVNSKVMWIPMSMQTAFLASVALWVSGNHQLHHKLRTFQANTMTPSMAPASATQQQTKPTKSWPVFVIQAAAIQI